MTDTKLRKCNDKKKKETEEGESKIRREGEGKKMVELCFYYSSLMLLKTNETIKSEEKHLHLI
jgi:hypothetical protein